MAIEIERKFLVRDDEWRSRVLRVVPIRQGYFSRTSEMRARIRVYGNQGFVTLKSQPGTMSRHEYEYEIPHAHAVEIIERFGIEPLIEKVRHDVSHGGMTWSVDVFEGANAGLVMAEIELEREDQPVSLPSWVGQEVTHDPRFGNSNLARFPFRSWAAEGSGQLALAAAGSE